MEAKKFLNNDTLVLYSDIIFESNIIYQILESKKDISIAIDLNWRKMYEGRTEHLTSEAEHVLLNNNQKIIQIKKNIQDRNNSIGEFLGIIKLSSKGSKIFVKKYDHLIKTHKGNFHEASSISKAYLTDMIQELIDSHIDVEPVSILGKWCEIDTKQDLENAEKMFAC
jgi:choline kinase